MEEKIKAIIEKKHDDAVVRIAELIRRRGGRALLVGGCVRDSILQIDNKDFDLEVYGLSAESLRAAVAVEFPLDPVGASFGVFKVHHHDIDIALPRVENKTGAGHRGFMVETVPSLGFAEAAARRDFTINAILRDPLTGEIIDPWNGRADLERGILRHVSAHFSEDPLRVLRAMQFVARFGFSVAPETVRLCAGLAQDELPAERLGAEWEKLLQKGKTPSRGLNFLRDCGWLRYYPELAALVGCRQNPEWHPEGDVWTHTLGVLDAAAAMRSGNASDDLVLMLAALCHDFGKPAAAVCDETGAITTPGHDKLGLAPAAAFLGRLWRRNDLTDLVLPLVGAHMKPSMMVTQNVPDRTYRRLALEVKRMDLLAKLAECDVLGTANPPGKRAEKLDRVRIFRERVEALAVATEPPKPLVLGRHLLERGVAPGPAMGKILKKCFDAQLDGEFSDVSGGLACLDNLPEMASEVNSIRDVKNDVSRTL